MDGSGEDRSAREAPAQEHGEEGEAEQPSDWRSILTPTAALPALLVPDRGTLLEVLHLIVFLDALGTAFVMPVVPHLGRAFSAGPGGVGFLYAVYALGLATTPVTSSFLSARIGRRRTILVLLAARALAFFLQGLTQAFGTFLTTRLLTGLVAGTGFVARASASDLAATKERSRVLARSSAAAVAALVVGPGIGGGLASFGLHTPILVASVFSVFALALAAALLHGLPEEAAGGGAFEPHEERGGSDHAAEAGRARDEEQGEEEEGENEEEEGEGNNEEEDEAGGSPGSGRVHGPPKTSAASEVAAWLRHPFRRIIPLLLVACFCAVGGSVALYTVFALLSADEFGYGAPAWGFLLSGSALVSVVTQLALYPALSRSMGKHFTAVATSLAMAVGVAILPLAAVPAPTLLFALLYAMGFAALAPAAHALLLRYAPPFARERVLAWSEAVASAAHVVVPPVLGAFYAGAPFTPFAVCALLGTTAALLFAVALLLNQRAHEQAARAAQEDRHRQTLLAADGGGGGEEEEEEEGDPTAGDTSGAAAAGETLTAEQVFGAETEGGVAGAGAGAGAAEEQGRASSVHGGEEAVRSADVEVTSRPVTTTEEEEAETGRLLLAALRRRGLASLAAGDAESRQRLHDLLESVIPPTGDATPPALFMLPGNVGPGGEEAEEVQGLELPINT